MAVYILDKELPPFSLILTSDAINQEYGNKKPYLLVKNENVNINTNDQNYENIAPNKISELQCFNDKQGKENNQIYAYKVDDINEI